MKGFHLAAHALMILLVCAALFPILQQRAFSSSPIYLDVEPNSLPPLTDLNSSVYGLEVPATPSAIGDNFTVEIHLRNATVTNVATGVEGVEVHLYFGNILAYAVPTGFVNKIGQPDGVLTGPDVLYGLGPGFFDAGVNPVSSPPYAGAVYFEVGAASSDKPWNGADGLVAVVSFRIVKQPQGSQGEPTVTLQLANDFTDIETNIIVDPYTNNTMAAPVSHDRIPGSLVLDSNYEPPANNYTLTVQESPAGSGTVDVNAGGINQTPPYTFSNGTVVQVAATPNAGYSFTNWILDAANAGSANPFSITMNSAHTVTANFTYAPPPPDLFPITLTAEPTAVPPFAGVNTRPYGLEIPPTQIVVGDMFTVGLHLRNATKGNVPLGVGSIEVHFWFGNVLDYVRPVSFAPSEFGGPEGVLNPDIRFSINPGFHGVNGDETPYPYDGAVSYDIAASSTGTGWNGVDGLVAVLTFEITKQPQSSLGKDAVGLPMDYTFTGLTDCNGSSVLHDCLNATITLDRVSHDVAVTDVTLLKTVIGEGYPMIINVTAANLGSVSEDFLLTVYANASVMDSQTISLASGNSTTVAFVRNTTGFAKGNYTIKAVAEAIPGEANTTDNTYTAGSVTVTIPGDLDGNEKVELVDLIRLVLSFQSQAGQPKWNPNADIDGNGIVDQSDANILAQHYGQHYP
ncbi:MAG: CARDB domain-containing protein [Candidatus Bathyarchaeia archaeon]